jgi:hypothetical protein
VPEANPGRPTVSKPATLTPVGYIQFETGALFAEDSAEFSKRIGIGQVTRPSVLPRPELFLQIEPLAIIQSKDQTAVHEGEVFAGVQSVLFPGDESRPTISRSNQRRFFWVKIFADFTSIRTGSLPSRFRAMYVERSSQTLSILHSLGKFTISGELWHFSRPFEKGNTVVNLWAVSRALRKNLVVDAGPRVSLYCLFGSLSLVCDHQRLECRNKNGIKRGQFGLCS